MVIQTEDENADEVPRSGSALAHAFLLRSGDSAESNHLYHRPITIRSTTSMSRDLTVKLIRLGNKVKPLRSFGLFSIRPRLRDMHGCRAGGFEKIQRASVPEEADDILRSFTRLFGSDHMVKVTTKNADHHGLFVHNRSDIFQRFW